MLNLDTTQTISIRRPMKTLLALSFLCVFLFVAPPGTPAATLLTFDDFNLSPNDFVTIPNSYQGLGWSGFGMFNGSTAPESEGYRTGMVSPNNVAFNDDEYDRSAQISSSTPFNFDSAYMTAAFNNGMRVEVQGFVGTLLTYDNTYVLQETGPSFINFNYTGVDVVNFNLPEGPDIWVMDNLTINATPEPKTWTLLAAGVIGAGFGALRKKVRRTGVQSEVPI